MFRAFQKAGWLVTYIGLIGASTFLITVGGKASGQSPSEVQTQKTTPVAPGANRGMRSEPDPIDFDDTAGWTSMFDGKTLNGWDGDPDVWRVVDGAIVGDLPTPPAGSPHFRGTYLVWQGGEPGDFEIKLEIKLEGPRTDSGIQFRAFVAPPHRAPEGHPQPDPRQAKWDLGGYQFDLSLGDSQTSGLIGEVAGRGILAYPGQAVRTEADKNLRLIGNLGDRKELGSYFKNDDWNQAYLIVRGDTMISILNNHVMAIVVDGDATKERSKGLIALQYSGIPCKISFRNIRIRMIP